MDQFSSQLGSSTDLCRMEFNCRNCQLYFLELENDILSDFFFLNLNKFSIIKIQVSVPTVVNAFNHGLLWNWIDLIVRYYARETFNVPIIA